MSQESRPDCGIPYADISWVKRKWLDIPYLAQSESQKLDIYLPKEGDGPFPVIISIHGGAFMLGDKQDIQVIPHLSGLKRGVAVVGVNYRLSGEAIFPAGIQDVKSAILYIKKHASEYKLDPNRIITWGGSAGGYYSTIMALTDEIDTFNPPNMDNELSTRIQGAVDWFGPTDFLKMDKEFRITGNGVCDHDDADSPESLYLGEKITRIPEKVQEANPLNYVSDKMPPMFIQHGSIDHLVPTGQSKILVEKIKEVVGEDRVEFEILEGADHGGPQFDCEENLEKVFAFINKILK